MRAKRRRPQRLLHSRLLIGSVCRHRLALLQRLLRPQLPRKRDGELMGPERVWLHLPELPQIWCREHLGRSPKALTLLRQDWPASARRQNG